VSAFLDARDDLISEERLIQASGVTVQSGERILLRNIDLTVRRGQIVTLIGPNGAGKSTLIRVVVGLLKPAMGTVRHKPDLRIGYVPQYFHVDRFLPLTVRRFLQLASRSGQSSLEAALARVRIQHVLETPLQALSGGETRRVLLSRALLNDPDVLVLDEPTTGVDVTGQAGLYGLIGRLRKRRHCAALIVSHDLHLVMAATDEVICLSHGHICCSGRPEAVSQHPEYLALFGRRAGQTLAVYAHHHDHRHDQAGNVVPLSEQGAPLHQESPHG
jgi:ABC-type Mn/Zn transport systems, ATPase component